MLGEADGSTGLSQGEGLGMARGLVDLAGLGKEAEAWLGLTREQGEGYEAHAVNARPKRRGR